MSGRNGDFNPSVLAQAISTDAINNVVVRAWVDDAGVDWLHSFSSNRLNEFLCVLGHVLTYTI